MATICYLSFHLVGLLPYFHILCPNVSSASSTSLSGAGLSGGVLTTAVPAQCTHNTT
jgi:hypothetical protein